MADLRTELRGSTGAKGLLLCLIAASVGLAACGGGGGKGGGAPQLHAGGAPQLHTGGHFEAARAAPIAGSVTQSSNHSAGVTANSVTVTIEPIRGDLTQRIGSPGWGFENQPVELDYQTDINGNTWRDMRVTRMYGDGSLRVVDTYTDADPNAFEDDYLVMGYWLRFPARYFDEDGSPVDLSEYSIAQLVRDVEYGLFADGGDPYEQNNILALTGTATFNGDAVTAYIDTVNDKDSLLAARVALTVDFGTNTEPGTVEGRVFDFQRLSGEAPIARELTDTEIAQLGVMTLGTASIEGSDSGFFTGDTTMTADGDSLTGKWGGQFYGNGQTPQDQPSAVAGTFGATDRQKTVVGSYGARR